jgi:hypothetical protein
MILSLPALSVPRVLQVPEVLGCGAEGAGGAAGAVLKVLNVQSAGTAL